MFAPAYMGRKRIFQMLSLRRTTILALSRSLSAHVIEALEGAAPLTVFASPTYHKNVILRACDFFAFAQKRLLSLERGVVDGKASSPPNNCPIPWQRSFPFQQPSPFCHPERTRISYFAALTGATYVVLLKENHMQLFEAATLDRKSGEAEGSAVRHSGAPNLPFYNHFPFVTR
jgi:hypothetical protein